MKKKTIAVIITALIIIAIFSVSWFATCALIKLISLCFGFTFTWKLATGIWLVMFILRSIFKTTVKNK